MGGPFEVVSGLGVNFKIKSKESKITVVHHNRLKRYAPLNDGKVICPARELGGDMVVYNSPTNDVQLNCGNSPNIPPLPPIVAF